VNNHDVLLPSPTLSLSDLLSVVPPGQRLSRERNVTTSLPHKKCDGIVWLKKQY
jgi:hypothetical protein